ncbi:hypothetical protein FHL15_005431 [Xylaria flabelliformis]|uniref:CFEM domain-containing protein n=1 Tax=Xylaria flabelliformis TaxID=2512241 RepID=A0A553I0P8_9PEZI|nr:hypothetical protein FHL15_005431 [Xylaria flabelliformis]
MLGRTVVAWTVTVFASVAFAAGLSGVNLNEIPQCGLLCIVNTVTEKSSCAPTDFPCICANAPLNNEIEACFDTQCSPRDALTTAKIAKDLCGVPKRNRGLIAWVVPLVAIILSTVFYLLRLLSRAVLRQRVDVADFILGVSVVATFPVLWIAFQLAADGLGQDIWEIPQDNITQILYSRSSNAIRFTGPGPLGMDHTRVTVTTSTSNHGSLGRHFASSSACELDCFGKEENSALDYVQSRVLTLVVFADSTNITYDYVEPGIYSIIEASVAITVCCLPAVRALLSTVMPSVFATTVARSPFSSGNPPQNDSSRQKFNRLDTPHTSSEQARIPKEEWATHSSSASKSESHVELMPMTFDGIETDVEDRQAGQDAAQNRTMNWSRPLPRGRESGSA